MRKGNLNEEKKISGGPVGKKDLREIIRRKLLHAIATNLQI